MEYLSLLKRNLAVSDPYSLQRLQQEKNALNSVVQNQFITSSKFYTITLD